MSANNVGENHIMSYFHKEILSNAVYHNGKPLPFVPVEDANGILQTDDAELAAKLTDMAARRVGGIRVLTPEQYEELKKKPTVTVLVTETRYGNSGPRLIANSVPMSKASQQQVPAPPAVAPAAVQAAVEASRVQSAPVAAPLAPSKPPIATRKGKAAKAAVPTPTTV